MNWINPTKFKGHWKIFSLVIFLEICAIFYWSFHREKVDLINYAIYFTSVLLLAIVCCLNLLYKAYLKKENLLINIFVSLICILIYWVSTYIVFIGFINLNSK